jgi:predicted dehydrogenase
MRPIRIGIIGAGAVSEQYHLPAAQCCREIHVDALVDKNLERARFLGDRFDVPRITSNYSDLFGEVEGVINALPHHLHATVTNECLERGIAVLVEKPLALTVEDAVGMVKAADVNKVTLQVGHIYRFCPGARLVKQAIEEDWLGSLQSFSLESGCIYNWPVASGFFFSKEQAGGGVLVDTGSHMLDLLNWWLGDAIHVDYRDDSLGGVEADCLLSAVLGASGRPVRGNVRLSRLRNLSNAARIVGERFTIEYDLTTTGRVSIWPTMSEYKNPPFVTDVGSLPRPWNFVYTEQLRNFARAIITGEESVVTGESVLATVGLIERCYRERQRYEMPWMRPAFSA